MDPALAGVIAALVAGLGGFLAAVWRFSGKIESSEAKDLWAESRAIRDWSQERIKVQNDTIARLEQRLTVVEAKNDELLRENMRLLNKLAGRPAGGSDATRYE